LLHSNGFIRLTKTRKIVIRHRRLKAETNRLIDLWQREIHSDSLLPNFAVLRPNAKR